MSVPSAASNKRMQRRPRSESLIVPSVYGAAPVMRSVMLVPEAAWLASPRQASLALLSQVDPAGKQRRTKQASSAVGRGHGAAYVGVRA
jgi:hypothetical protein